jgi:hypothetical protein
MAVTLLKFMSTLTLMEFLIVLASNIQHQIYQIVGGKTSTCAEIAMDLLLLQMMMGWTTATRFHLLTTMFRITTM